MQRPVLIALGVLLLPGASLAEEQIVISPDQSLASDYCESFANVASELRSRRQKDELDKMEKAITSKLAEVTARTEELKATITARDEMLKLASDELLKIYTQMDAEAAARQLEKIDAKTAASVIRRLKPKLASDILSAMDIKRASSLVQAIANQNAAIEADDKS
jgi:flagellar motility protein MotE (MotC chaperone)